jgi:hypothetical protein
VNTYDTTQWSQCKQAACTLIAQRSNQRHSKHIDQTRQSRMHNHFAARHSNTHDGASARYVLQVNGRNHPTRPRQELTMLTNGALCRSASSTSHPRHVDAVSIRAYTRSNARHRILPSANGVSVLDAARHFALQPRGSAGQDAASPPERPSRRGARRELVELGYGRCGESPRKRLVNLGESSSPDSDVDGSFSAGVPRTAATARTGRAVCRARRTARGPDAQSTLLTDASDRPRRCHHSQQHTGAHAYRAERHP